jgi:hypothetical protein
MEEPELSEQDRQTPPASNHFPPEVLSHIFRYYASDALSYPLCYPKDKGYRFLPLRVCSSWKKAALGTSDLWTGVEIDREDLVDEVGFESLVEWLLRSRKRQLTVSLIFEKDVWARKTKKLTASRAERAVDIILKTLIAQVRRWADVTLVCPEYVLVMIMRVISRARSLRTFSITMCEDDMSQGYGPGSRDVGQPIVIDGSHPGSRGILLSSLRELEFGLQSVHDLPNWRLPALEVLRLDGFACTTNELMDAISRWDLPQLNTLAFNDFQGHYEENVEDQMGAYQDTSARLPKLSKLQLLSSNCLISSIGATMLRVHPEIDHLQVMMDDPHDRRFGNRLMERLFVHAINVRVVKLVFSEHDSEYGGPYHGTPLWETHDVRMILGYIPSTTTLELSMAECAHWLCQHYDQHGLCQLEPFLFDFISLLGERDPNSQKLYCPSLTSLTVNGIPCEEDELLHVVEARESGASMLKVTLRNCPSMPDIEEAGSDALERLLEDMTEINLPFLPHGFLCGRDEYWS